MATWSTALLPLLGVLTGAGLQFLAGRSLERRRHLSQLKAQAYADYFKAVSALATSDKTASANRDLADAKSRICLYGSDKVLACLGQLERIGPDLSSKPARDAVVALVKEARKDTSAGAGNDTAEDLALVLFGREAVGQDIRWASMDALDYERKIRSEWEDRFPTKS